MYDKIDIRRTRGGIWTVSWYDKEMKTETAGVIRGRFRRLETYDNAGYAQNRVDDLIAAGYLIASRAAYWKLCTAARADRAER